MVRKNLLSDQYLMFYLVRNLLPDSGARYSDIFLLIISLLINLLFVNPYRFSLSTMFFAHSKYHFFYLFFIFLSFCL